MNTIPIVFVFDYEMIIGAYVAIKSLIANAKNNTCYYIHIFHKGLKEIHIKNFETFVSPYHKIQFHEINSKYFANAPKQKHGWTEMVYYRLLIPEILPQYDKVIYSDVDVLFKDDLYELYNTNIENYELAAFATSINIDNQANQAMGKVYFPENKNEFQYNSGVLLINTKLMNKENTVLKFLTNIEKYKTKLKFFDQDILNITCNKVKNLNMKYNMFQPIYYNKDFTHTKEYDVLKSVYSKEELEEAKKQAVIIHYAGPPGKPWLIPNPPEDYKKYLDTIPKELAIYTKYASCVKFLNEHPNIAKIYRSTKQLLKFK